MDRRQFLTLTAASLTHAAPAASPFYFFTPQEGERMRQFLAADPARRELLMRNGHRMLNAGPWSVTRQRPSNVNSQPNDYYSEGPYWWPDPKNPDGPYIRKDGQRNPNRFEANRRDLGSMCEAVLALGSAAYLLNNARCAERAALVLDTWFLAPKTKMNPHLEFGQAVRGHNTGRGTGIIDTVSLIHCAAGASMAAAAKMDASVLTGVRQWFAGYVKWMTTSTKGLDEKKANNNHATWWTAQVAAFATFADVAPARETAWSQYRNHLLPAQLEPDGSCPREEARTLSLSYSSMNLDGYAVLCRLAEFAGQDLWHYQTEKGIGIERAFRYLIPFVLEPAKWKKQQIHAYERDKPVFPGLAGLGLQSAELLAAYRNLPRASSAWIQLVDLLVQSAA